MDERFRADDHLTDDDNREPDDRQTQANRTTATPVRYDHTSGRFTKPWPRRVAGFLGSQLLAAAVFIGLPALVTAIAPVSWIKYERRGDQVAATAQTCLLFFVPYKTVHVANVTGFNKRIVAGTETRERRTGRSDRVTRSEDQGYLLVQAVAASTEIPVTPHDIDSVIERSEAFLKSSQPSELKLFVVANWKFSILMGGIVSLLTVLYFATILFGILLKMIHLVQKLLGVPPQRRWLVKALAKA